MTESLFTIRTTPATPADPRWPAWNSVPSAPPDVSATPQARVTSWSAYRSDAGAEVTIGCFGFELGGYTDELAQVLFDRTEPFAVRPLGVNVARRDAWKAHGFERREVLHFDAPDTHGVLAFGFPAGALQSCFAVGRGVGADEAVAGAAFTTPLEAPPSPSLAQAAALGALAHPRGVAGGVVLLFVLVLAALLFGKRG